MRLSFVVPAFCAACLVSASAYAQEGGFTDDLQTGLDEITIQPLDEGDNVGGFGTGGLSLEDLQNLPNGGFQEELKDITTELQEKVASAPGATVRALDKLTGEVKDLALETGGNQTFGRINVFLGDCRYPVENPSGNAYAYLVVRQEGVEAPVFSGWMVASSPALNAMDNQRYDIWPLSCKTS
ncbi:DUF2155 domain-containing protein [Celeribacter neptunius]|uniref:DUF2155 domain-containing protein n=1 Tax=Celeribacter neptunius TaxID=588602 RepID=A0A1I3N5Q6_9RHOB|nr:DUF2155 domain-containing protein [Celeribacter neptunius]SFJ04613.1 hypothetical protein SAMN04487991_1270 [Celeribacter neptunius]